jgi:hypothetical protein
MARPECFIIRRESSEIPITYERANKNFHSSVIRDLSNNCNAANLSGFERSAREEGNLLWSSFVSSSNSTYALDSFPSFGNDEMNANKRLLMTARAASAEQTDNSTRLTRRMLQSARSLAFHPSTAPRTCSLFLMLQEI